MEQTPTRLSQGAKTESDFRSGSETEIQHFLNDFAAAIRGGNTKEIMSFYADDIVTFDMMPPLQFTDRKELEQKSWNECFTNYFKFPVQYDYSQTRIFADGDVAFLSALVHFVGTSKGLGEEMENWLRCTMGLRRLNGKWLIAHDHHSVPVDDNLMALMDLQPEKPIH